MSAVEIIRAAQPIGGTTQASGTVDLKDVSLLNPQNGFYDKARSCESLSQMIGNLIRQGHTQPPPPPPPRNKRQGLTAPCPGTEALPPQIAEEQNESPRQTRSKTDKPKCTLIAKESLEKRTKSPKKSRKSAKTRARSQYSMDMDPRETSLEKNRVAACKSRIRKKRWTETLEEKKQVLEASHRELQAQYVGLLQELSQLKDFLITHAACHEPNIDMWIQHEASKYVGKLTENSRHRTGSIQSSFSNTQDSESVSVYSLSSQSRQSSNGPAENDEDAYMDSLLQ